MFLNRYDDSYLRVITTYHFAISHRYLECFNYFSVNFSIITIFIKPILINNKKFIKASSVFLAFP